MAPCLEDVKRRAAESIEASSARLGALSREIWSRPELAYEEREAHAALTRFFAGCGASWSVQPRYKLETAFRADWRWNGAASAAQGPREPEPAAPLRLGFLCEYDALPGLGHACGHNLIAEVSVIGTLAEEGGTGKTKLIDAGAFDNLDVVFMAHPYQEDMAYKPALTHHNLTVKYCGKASHAAAYPWEGVNALDAAVLAYNNLLVLRQQMKPTWRVHGIIKNGEKPNIVPAYTEVEFYLRTPRLKELPLLIEKAESCLKAAAQATGCKMELKSKHPDYYNVLQNKCLEQIYIENGKSLGMNFSDVSLCTPLASTDFGNVSFIVPGIHSYFYIGSDALNHTEQFTEAAGSEAAQQYALRTAKALAMTALDVIFSPGLLDKVREDFRQAQLEEREH